VQEELASAKADEDAQGEAIRSLKGVNKVVVLRKRWLVTTEVQVTSTLKQPKIKTSAIQGAVPPLLLPHRVSCRGWGGERMEHATATGSAH
jgi:hypothetical protein